MINIAEALARETRKIIYASDQDDLNEKEIYKEATIIESKLLAHSSKIDAIPKLREKLLVF